ncbi:MAG: iron-siderophore ABC transporter substrate-binding protein [Dehalococcoidia bacterium]|nr:iron-siderophore ABC transporter substrate-binding protein [Dehalococcoidia bacterium]
MATGTATGTASSGSANAASSFPVSIEHAFGATAIDAEPQRVLTIGYTEQDPVLALGVTPVAVREWFGAQPHAVWPWAQDELGDAAPEVLEMPFGELDYEVIAGLDPDLVVATHSGITEEEYGRLSEIAPTLARPGDYPAFGVPWQEQTRLIGRALGREDRASEIVANTEETIANAAGEHPEFDGATIAWASPAGDGQYWAVGPTTPPMRFLSELGFSMDQELADAIGDRDSLQVSAEQLNLLDADILIFVASTPDEREAFENDSLVQQLDVVQDSRVIFFEGNDDPVYGALSFSTVLSLPYAVDNLVPRLSEALSTGD